MIRGLPSHPTHGITLPRQYYQQPGSHPHAVGVDIVDVRRAGGVEGLYELHRYAHAEHEYATQPPAPPGEGEVAEQGAGEQATGVVEGIDHVEFEWRRRRARAHAEIHAQEQHREKQDLVKEPVAGPVAEKAYPHSGREFLIRKADVG